LVDDDAGCLAGSGVGTAADTSNQADMLAEHLLMAIGGRAWEFEKRGIRYPLCVPRCDRSWRATLKSLAVNTPLDENLFTPALAADQ
jgi:hypothetical protein